MFTSKKALVLPLLILIQILFVVLYVRAEHTVYFWDFAMYAQMAQNWFASPDKGALFAASLAQDYNLLFAAPALASFALFGTARLVFILTLFFVWFALYEAALAFLLHRVFGFDAKKAGIAALLSCLAQPPLWVPLFEGYPDYGAAAALTFALALILPARKSLRSAIAVGLLLSFAIALRRPFAYPALVLLGTEGVFSLISVWRDKAWAQIKTQALWLGMAGGAMALGVLTIEPAYVLHVLTTDFTALYKSYETNFGTILRFGLVWGGLGLWGLSAAGFVLAWRLFPTRRRALAFLSVFAGGWLFLWGMGPAQASLHYFLHAPFIWNSVGLTGLYLALTVSKSKLWGRAVCLCFLGFNTVWALGLAPTTTLPHGLNRPVRFFSAPRPPAQRGDLATLDNLAQTLINTTSPQDKIVVVGSSFLWNQDILRAVFTDRIQDPAFIRHMVWAPEIDGEQPPPYAALAQGTVFIVPDKPQYHLAPQGQKVVTALASQFPPAEANAGLFTRDAETFPLDDAVTLSVWRRHSPWTPAALAATLQAVAAQTASPAPTVIQTADRVIQALVPLPPALYRLRLDLPPDPACHALQGLITLVSPDGAACGTEKFGPFHEGDAQVFAFFKAPQACFFSVTITEPEPEACPLSHLGMHLEPAPAAPQ